jgi:16S rRNA (cytosine1402-N4)-methyltransferase
LEIENLEGERKFDGGLFIDATLGTAGHTIEFLKAHPRNRVFAFDRDAESMRFAWERLQEENLAHRVALVQSDFRLAGQALGELQKVVAANFVDGKVGSLVTGNSPRESLLENFENWEVVERKDDESFAPRIRFVGHEFASRPVTKVAGALIDAGMSLHQVAWAERGLSFRADAPLDMRYDRTRGVSAFDLVNELSQDELEDLFFKFTDERWARRIAEFITEHRRRQVIHTTSELAAIIEAAIPAGVRRRMRVHPATRAFAALRLAVNDEFWALEEGVWALSAVLANEARLAVLTYSSHEDRTVKRTFRRLAGRPLEMENRFQKRREKRSALSNPQSDSSMRPPLTPFQTLENFSLRLPTEADQNAVPDWITGFESEWKMKIITGKPIEPSEEEVEANPLSRSCKLRVLEKVEL